MRVVRLIAASLTVALTALADSPAHAQQGQLARPSGAAVPLESLPLLNPSNDASSERANIIPPGNSANYHGRPITHGIQFLNGNYLYKAHAAIRLWGRYQRLSGTVYTDDASDLNSQPTFEIYDLGNTNPTTAGASDITQGRVILRYTFKHKEALPFSIDVHGVKSIGIVIDDAENIGKAELDVVASLLIKSSHRS